MPITSKIREQIISTFKAEVAEHIQTISNGLLALEKYQQNREDRQATLQEVFRSAHSMKGAARAVGVAMVEQLAHGLENILSDLQKGAILPAPEIYTACYKTLDAIQAVETSFEAGETVPPVNVVQTLTDLEALRSARQVAIPVLSPESSATLPSSILGSETAPAVAVPTLETDQASSSNTTPTPVTPPSTWTDGTIRVRVDKLDAVIDQLSELLMAKIRLDQRLLQVKALQTAVNQWQKEWMNGRNHSVLRGMDPAWPNAPMSLEWRSPSGESQSSLAWIKEINKKVNDLARDYSNDTIRMSIAIDALEREVKQIRLLPLSTITGTFERMIRDLATSANKKVDFEVIGADVEMDKRVLELVKDPLIHLLRNAIDHGIEPLIERKRMKKPPAGKITLSAEQQGKNISLKVSDDGSGLDLAAIRKSVSHHTRSATRGMSEAELIEWIFNPGISTSPMINSVSGRGIGLDVVRKNIEALQGHIDVQWVPDAGTTFILTIPTALTSSRVLLVQAASHQFAIPLNEVERILTVHSESISFLGGDQVLSYGGHTIPLAWLKNVLGLPEPDSKPDPSGLCQVVILCSAERHMAFIVDDLVGEQEIVMKGLGKQLVRVAGIAGATILGSGKILLVLNTADLIKLASRTDARRNATFHPLASQATQKKAQKRILVVDDSITTRNLEKNILEAEGFLVQVATDGQEALSIIATKGLPDLVISDINMPHIDGFELTRRIKTDPRMDQVPVFLVSSLDSPEDKAHGIQVGADAYIEKSHFDQTSLLEQIQQVIG